MRLGVWMGWPDEKGQTSFANDNGANGSIVRRWPSAKAAASPSEPWRRLAGTSATAK
jgi:hypothetical protein